MTKKQHDVGVTLGDPVGGHKFKRPGVTDAEPRFRAICTCGWSSESMLGTAAQSEALSHQAGKRVQRSFLRVRTIPKDKGMSGVRAYTFKAGTVADA